MSKLYGGIAAVGLAVVGLFHFLWAFSPWPLANWSDFALVVLGAPDAKVPALLPPASVAVALGLLAAAYLVSARTALVSMAGPQWVYRFGVWAVAVIMLTRATLLGFIPSGLDLIGSPHVYIKWDLWLYSPVCLVLGVLLVLAGTSPLRPQTTAK